jgi:U3 small nucleolar RNA-associated protein 3
MGKRRNTAKTGDKALYNSRQRVASASSNNTKKKNEDDPMYNEIDHFHNERDEEYISLGNQADYNGDGEDEDLTGNKESVLDLGAGVGESSSDDDDSDSDDSDEEHDGKQKQNRDINPTHHSDDNTSSSESESDDDDDLKDELSSPDDPRNWGKKKSLYYHGDTADLEIGQEEEDAFLEEEAAKEIQATRFQEMDEDDFVLSEHEDEEKDVSEKKKSHKAGVMLQATRDVSKLTKKEARKLLQKQHPGKKCTMERMNALYLGRELYSLPPTFISYVQNCCPWFRISPISSKI